MKKQEAKRRALITDLKDALKGKVQETLSAVADDGIEQSGLHIWSFGQLPESYEQKRGNYKVKAYWRWWMNATAWRSNCLIIRWNKSRQCGTVFAVYCC